MILWYNTCSEIDRPSNGVAILTTPSRNQFLSISERVIAMSYYVYLITDGTYTKIGISNNPQKRLRSLQTANPRKLSIAHTVQLESKDDASLLEFALHQYFDKARVSGEWILLPFEIIKDAIPIVEQHIKNELNAQSERDRLFQIRERQETFELATELLKTRNLDTSTQNIAIQYIFNYLVANDTAYSRRHGAREITTGIQYVSLLKKAE